MIISSFVRIYLLIQAANLNRALTMPPLLCNFLFEAKHVGFANFWRGIRKHRYQQDVQRTTAP